MNQIRYGSIFRVVGILLCVIAFSLLLCLPFSHYYQTGLGSVFLSSALLCLLIGMLVWSASGRMDLTVNKREGYLIVFVAWIVLWVSCAMPYLLSGTLDS